MMKVMQRLDDLERKLYDFKNLQPQYDVIESRPQIGGMRKNTRHRTGYRNRGRGFYQVNRIAEDQAQPEENTQQPLN
ncbi:hypothetical protein DPMN_165153 [Dreissena polymorpha]|uniref:Uncharacterized protein n=1 Tax=Dreissena polymorpha TaxID=45954 RepID=A0A9D4EWK9_DREPO|nr:hypothetical protein DPMN_165153 [Dreissena polymorpha]